jgi:hypothetical protein
VLRRGIWLPALTVVAVKIWLTRDPEEG